MCAEYSKNHTELIDQRRQSSDDDNRRPDDEILDDEDDRTSLKDIVAVASMHNDSHVIAQIIEEYEMRLKEQVTMAKEDIVQALEEQIQVSLCVVKCVLSSPITNNEGYGLCGLFRCVSNRAVWCYVNEFWPRLSSLHA